MRSPETTLRKRKPPAAQRRLIRQTRKTEPLASFDLEPLGGVSRYQLIRQILRRKILSGELAAGERLPPEIELARQYGVSRITTMQALSALASEGLIVRQQGRGTFVARRADRKVRIAKFTGTLEDVIRDARGVGTKLLAHEEVSAPSDVAELLKVRARSPLTLITRLRLIAGSPSILARNYIRTEWARYLVPGKVDWDRTMLELLEREAGMTIDVGRLTIQAETADAAVAVLLQVPVGSPILQVRRLDISRRHGPIQYVVSDVRADRYVYSVDLVRHRQGENGFWQHSQHPIQGRKTR
jgi:GntR family transcriptional regulator